MECLNYEVLKKQSPNGRLTVYLSKRELIINDGASEPIDGVVLIDDPPEDLRVFAMVVLTFRYGREDEEVMGLKFYTEAILHFSQIYPPAKEEEEATLTPLQQHLLKKLGPDAYPLTVCVSGQAPHSVGLKPARTYRGSPLGVTYDLKVFLGKRPDDKPPKRAQVRLSLRCIHRSPDPEPTPPAAVLSRAFVFSPGRLHVEARLDREAIRAAQPLRVHVLLRNDTNRTVHRVRVSLVQRVNVCMFTNGRFKNLVGLAETESRHPVQPGRCLSRDFCVKPASVLHYPVALAVEGGLPEMRLAPSTLPELASEKNPYGVTVTYEAKVKVSLGVVDRPAVLRLPFRVLEEPPEEAPTSAAPPEEAPASSLVLFPT